MVAEIYPRMTSLIKNSKWRRDLLKGCIIDPYMMGGLKTKGSLMVSQFGDFFWSHVHAVGEFAFLHSSQADVALSGYVLLYSPLKR